MAERDKNEFSGRQFCGNCGAAVAPGASACSHCATPVQRATPMQPEENAQVLLEDYTPYCRACGVAVAREAALHCPQCGVGPLCHQHFYPSSQTCALCPSSGVAPPGEQDPSSLPNRPRGPWAQPATMFPCHRCGARLRHGVGFCPSCGAKHPGVGENSKNVGFLPRLGASIIDVVVPILASGIVIALIDLPGVFPLIFVCYHTIFTYNFGQTPGKMMLGLQVVDAAGHRPTLKQIILREVLGKMIVFLTMFVGFLWVLWDPKKRGWHDYIGGTYVVKTERN